MDDISDHENASNQSLSVESNEDSHKENGSEKSVHSDEDKTYEVETVLETKMRGHQRIFLIKWKGYPASENSWEPEENLGNARKAIDKFMAKQEGKVKKIGTKRSATASGRVTRSSVESNGHGDAPEQKKLKHEDQGNEAGAKDVLAEVNDGALVAKKKRGRPKKDNTPAKASEKEPETPANASNGHDLRSTGRMNFINGEESPVGANAESEATDVEAQNTTSPALPIIQNDDAEEKSYVAKHEAKKEPAKKTNKEAAKVTKFAVNLKPDSAIASLKSIKFVSIEKSANYEELLVTTEVDGKRETISVKEANERYNKDVVEFLEKKLLNVFKNFDGV